MHIKEQTHAICVVEARRDVNGVLAQLAVADEGQQSVADREWLRRRAVELPEGVAASNGDGDDQKQQRGNHRLLCLYL